MSAGSLASNSVRVVSKALLIFFKGHSMLSIFSNICRLRENRVRAMILPLTLSAEQEAASSGCPLLRRPGASWVARTAASGGLSGLGDQGQEPGGVLKGAPGSAEIRIFSNTRFIGSHWGIRRFNPFVLLNSGGIQRIHNSRAYVVWKKMVSPEKNCVLCSLND